MPFSFTQIEKDKSSRIGFVFCFLIFFYFLVAIALYWLAKLYFLMEIQRQRSLEGVSFGLSGQEVFSTLGVALIVGAGHWIISTNDIVRKILTLMQAKTLDPKDSHHAKFQNILDEISVATGGVKFEGAVVSTSAMNAFALADFNGRYVIGVTEGLLSRLNRAQLETVVAHEAAHILKGDCLETTVTTSLFDLYQDLISTMGDGIRASRRGNLAMVFLFGYVFLQITLFVSQFFRMFISREREYRADAIAVRLTRDPLSLAEALYMVSKRWRGYGVPGDGMEAIFIVSPQYHALDEGEGLFSDLFSTHPPIEKRLAILLDMARSNMQQLEEKFQKQVKIQEQAPDPVPASMTPPIPIPVNVALDAPTVAQWEVYSVGQWRGPYSIPQLMNLGWVEHDAFVRKIGDSHIVRLFEASEIKEFNTKGAFNSLAISCPLCQVSLQEDQYKGACVLRCQNCAGILLSEEDVQKILSRDDYFFSDRIREIAESLLLSQQKAEIKPINLKTANLLFCPRCVKGPKHKMLRNFYTLAYPVEIDRCFYCKSIWFDRSELEVLQYMISKNVKSNEKP